MSRSCSPNRARRSTAASARLTLPRSAADGQPESGLEDQLWVLEQLGQTLEAEGRLDEYQPFLDEALERLASESEHPNLTARSEEIARQYAGYPWVRRARQARRRR